jgi:hypothetical protein
MPVTIASTGIFNGGVQAGLPVAAGAAYGITSPGPGTNASAGLAKVTGTGLAPALAGATRIRHVGTALGYGTAGDETPATFLSYVGAGNLALLHFFMGASIPASLSAAPYSIPSYAGVYRVLLDFELTHYGYSGGIYGSGGTPAGGAVTDLGNLQTFLTSCQAGGLDVTVQLWHEPYNKFNLGTQSQNNLDFTNSMGYYGSMLRSLGIPVKFNPSNYSANSSYGHWAATIGNAGAPGLGWAACAAGYIDEVVTDIYVNEASSGPPGVQGTLTDCFGLANAFSLPFGMNEYGYAPAGGAAYTQTDINAFSSYILGYFQNLLAANYPVCDLVTWATNDNAVTAGMYLASAWSGTTIANYQSLFSGFDGGIY